VRRSRLLDGMTFAVPSATGLGLLSQLADAAAPDLKELSQDDVGLDDDHHEREVLMVFDALQTWMGTQRRGCAFVNAYAELGDSAHPAVPVIRAEKAWMRTLFDTLTGDSDVGAHLHLLYEGTLVILTAGANPGAVTDARRSVRTVMARANA
jgi:hypothetical protein